MEYVKSADFSGCKFEMINLMLSQSILKHLKFFALNSYNFILVIFAHCYILELFTC